MENRSKADPHSVDVDFSLGSAGSPLGMDKFSAIPIPWRLFQKPCRHRKPPISAQPKPLLPVRSSQHMRTLHGDSPLEYMLIACREITTQRNHRNTRNEIW